MKTASASSIENSRSSKLRFTLRPHHVLNIKYQQKKKTVFAASPRTYQALRGAALSMKTASARSIENSRSSKLRFTLRPHHVLNIKYQQKKKTVFAASPRTYQALRGCPQLTMKISDFWFIFKCFGVKMCFFRKFPDDSVWLCLDKFKNMFCFQLRTLKFN